MIPSPGSTKKRPDLQLHAATTPFGYTPNYSPGAAPTAKQTAAPVPIPTDETGSTTMPLRPRSMKELRADRERRGIDDSKHATDYRASRGGWYPPKDGEPGSKNGRRNRG